MDTAPQTAGTPAADTGAPASTDTLLTAPPEAAPAQQPTQPADGQATAGADAQANGSTKPEDKPEDKPQGAPEEYADFAAPEGMTFNPEALTDLKALAKEHNLSQEAAQKFADLGAKAVQKVQDGYREQIEQAQAQWAADSRTDKEFGGDALPENLSVAKRALDMFGSPELSKMLGESGLGNHPEIIRAFYRVGKAISEDKLVPGQTRPVETDPLKKLYPTMN